MRVIPACLLLCTAAFTQTDSPWLRSVPVAGTQGWFNLTDSFPVSGYAGNGCSVGCGFDGTHLWITNGAEFAGTNPTGVILIFKEDGTFVTAFDQNEAPGWGLRDLCCDGIYMYGSVGNTIDYYSLVSHEKIGSFVGPENPNRALAYRDSANRFYTGNFGNEMFELIWDGISGSTASSSVWSRECVTVYGAAWDMLNCCMWVTSADGSGVIVQLDENGNLIGSYTPLYGGATYGGATMGTTIPINTLWILHQTDDDELLAFDVTGSSLKRSTWGSIKSLF